MKVILPPCQRVSEMFQNLQSEKSFKKLMKNPKIKVKFKVFLGFSCVLGLKLLTETVNVQCERGMILRRKRLYRSSKVPSPTVGVLTQ